jgi:thiamine biosynthesis protein ThiS
MKLIVNGNSSELRDGATVSDLLESMGLQTSRVAVEVNLVVLAKETFVSHQLVDGDRVEIVGFMAGG